MLSGVWLWDSSVYPSQRGISADKQGGISSLLVDGGPSCREDVSPGPLLARLEIGNGLADKAGLIRPGDGAVSSGRVTRASVIECRIYPVWSSMAFMFGIDKLS